MSDQPVGSTPENTPSVPPTPAAPATPQASFTPPPAPQTPWVPPVKEPSGFKRGFGVGFGFMIGAGIVIAVLSIISLIGMIASAGAMAAAIRNQGGAATAATTTYEPIWGSADAKNTIRAIDITGTIYAAGGTASLLSGGGTYGYEIASQIDAMTAEESTGLLLLMDTPGGTINGSKAIADAVARYQERTGHKVIAYVQGMSASGGMYAMAGVDEIIADHGTLIGSIGVIMGPFTRLKDVTGTTGTIITDGYTTTGGITQEYFTAGTGKDFGNSFRDMTAAERENYQHGLDVEYDAFVNHVAAGRKMPADRIKNELGAFMFDPQTAIEKGLVDQMLGRNDAFTRAAELNGLDPADTKVVKPAMPSFLSSLLGAEARIYGHPAALKSDDVPQTSPLCTTAVTVLAYSGDMNALCR